jgi:hypothetical protein
VSVHRQFLIFGDYINAWSIQNGLQTLGLKGQCLSIESFARDPHLIDDAILFFTEEASWVFCAQRNLPFRFLPRPYEPVFVDKLLFSEYLCSIGEIPVPFSDFAGTSDFPCVLKPRRSWKGFRKQARGFVCFSQAEMDELLTTLRAQPPQEDDYFVQKFLVNADNISVSGFYDWQTPQRRFFIATRKVLGDGGTLNTGVIVETIPPPSGIGARVARVLSHLRYHGPFEMEFLYDTDTGQYCALEFNPRFWMQHGLFQVGYENVLIRAYLDGEFLCSLPVDADFMLPYKPLLWVDSCYPFVAISKRDGRALRIYSETIRKARRSGYGVNFFPSWAQAFQFALGRFVRRLKRPQSRQ